MSMQTSAAPRLVIPSLAGLYQALSPYSYAFMRFCVGAMLVPHGYLKLFVTGVGPLVPLFGAWGLPVPLAWAYWIAILEFGGGILLAVGFLTRPVALMVAVEMAVAVLGVHLAKGFLWGAGGFEYPLLWGLLCLAIAVRGGERLSVDRALGIEL
ncbi:MAG TPA: DoxX family protein [Stellaceae bacterium]|nr:DoxX family protein [Stellaceae bacterium]